MSRPRALLALALVLTLASPAARAQQKPPRSDDEPVRLRVVANGEVRLCEHLEEQVHEFHHRHALPPDLSQREVTTSFRVLCEAPCEVLVHDPKTRLFFQRSADHHSRIFTLDDQPNDVTAKVNVGNNALLAAGGLAIGIGLVAGYVGINDLRHQRANADAWTFGALLGGAALIGGGVTIVSFSDFDFELFPTPVRRDFTATSIAGR